MKEEQLYQIGQDRWIFVDLGRDEDFTVECEFQRNPDGTFTVLDMREIPKTHEETR